jgi:transcription elongation factor Elf1
MQQPLINLPDKKSVAVLPMVRNFKKVIESRNIKFMNNELYQFFNLNCGFIAHYDIDGFKATYSRPVDFANVFIRHFDSEHAFFNGVYSCHHEPYKDTGFKKADIKQEFFRIVDIHKKSISNWADRRQRSERYAAYLKLKMEFESVGIAICCDACGNDYVVSVEKDKKAYSDFGDICCLFCGQQIKFKNKRGEANVEYAEQRKVG